MNPYTKLALLTIGLVALFVIGIATMAHAEPQKTVCIFSPIDLYMDHNLVYVAQDEAQKFNVTTKIYDIRQEIENSTSNCNVIVEIQRGVNSNMMWMDYSQRYQVSGNVITLFTYKHAFNYANQGHGDPRKPMNNVNCLMEALNNRYHTSALENVYQRSTCITPYLSAPTTDEVPYYIIQKSLGVALEKLL